MIMSTGIPALTVMKPPPYWTDLEWVSNSNYPYVMQDINDFSYILGDLEYAYLDLDEDGVDELVLGWSDDPYTDSDYSLLAAVYAYIDGEVKGLDQSYYRTQVYLCEDGIARVYDSGGWLTGGYSWYRIVDGYENQFESLYYTNFDESGNLFDESGEALEITHFVDGEETVTAGTIDDVEEMLAEIDATYPPEEDISWESLL